MLLPLPAGAETLLILLLALLLDAFLGDWRLLNRYIPRPRALAARAGDWLDRRLNRIERSDATRRLRGLLTVLFLMLAALVGGTAVTVVARLLPYGWMLELLLVLRCVAVRQPWVGMRGVLDALSGPDASLEAGRSALAEISDRQSWRLDLHGVVRAAAEAGARDLARRVVAPAFWYALLGLPGMLAWTVADALAATIGHDTPRYADFGAAAARTGRIMGWLPARLTGGLLALGALFVPGAQGLGAVRAMLATAPGHPARDDAWPVAALAGALDLSLAGPRREGDMVVKEPWLGDGRARAQPADLRPALVLYHVTVMLTGLLAGAAGLALLRFGPVW